MCLSEESWRRAGGKSGARVVPPRPPDGEWRREAEGFPQVREMGTRRDSRVSGAGWAALVLGGHLLSGQDGEATGKMFKDQGERKSSWSGWPWKAFSMGGRSRGVHGGPAGRRQSSWLFGPCLGPTGPLSPDTHSRDPALTSPPHPSCVLLSGSEGAAWTTSIWAPGPPVYTH